MSELEIFAAVLPITDARERCAYLDGVCGPDAPLRQRVEELLRNDAEAGSFLEAPAGPRLVDAFSDPTQAVPCDDEETGKLLGILQPSTTPGALGRLGHYEVLEVLGQGGFGTVVRAFDEKLHRMVAIKIMASRLAATSPARKRFVREGRSSAAIRHENVVNIHAIEEQPIPFLVMEYVAGETLQQRIDRAGPLDLPDVLRIGLQIARGLVAAHAMGRIHRDIKPANILLETGVDRVKITDFGLARAADDASLTQSGVIAGTPLYMAPEQAQGLGVDHRADLFSLGSVLYVMCSGRPPFRAPTTLAVLKRVTEDTPRPIHEIIPEVSHWLCEVITKLHAKKPDDRFQTAQEVADMLAELQLHGKASPRFAIRSPELRNRSEESTPTGLFAPPMSRGTVARKRCWLAAAAVLLLLSVGLGLTEATGVTQFGGSVIRLFSPDGTLVVEVDDPDVSVTIDGEDIVIKGAGATEIRVKPGAHKVQANKDGRIVRQEVVTVAKRGRQVVRISREIGAPPQVAPAVNADHRAAEYALAVGATVIILEKGKDRHLWPGNDVPKEPFDLRVVSLIGNQKASDAGMDCFKDCKYLINIDLERTNITPAKILELRRALPTCKIEWDGDIKLLPDSSDRRAAEYVLSIGGLLAIKGGGLHRPIDSRSTLPRGAFVVRIVNLMHNSSVSDADLVVFKGCDRLDSLALGGTKVTDAGLVHLKECKSLKGVDLSGTQVSDDGLAHFKDHLSLSGMNLSGARITDKGLVHLKHHRKLTYLSLNATGVTDTGLADFKYYQSLAHLDLGRTQTSDVGFACFKDCKDLVNVVLAGTQVSNTGLTHLKDCKGLTFLDLGNTKISDAGLAHLKDCVNLSFLELNQTQVGDAGLAHLKDCKNLHHLNLADSQVSDAALEQLLGYPRLYMLNVKNTKVTPAGVKKLAAGLATCRIECDAGVIEPTANPDPDRRVAEWLWLNASFHVFADGKELQVFSYLDLPKTAFQLRRLNIVGNLKVSDETSSFFKGLRHLTHLRILNCKVTDAALGQFDECTHLAELTLHGTGVTNAGVARLSRFSKLQYVNLNQTAVTEAAVKKLAAALPRCKIEWNGGVIEPR